jgi:hypothetical protein
MDYKFVQIVIHYGDSIIHVYFDRGEAEDFIPSRSARLLLEAKHIGKPIGGKYSVVKHNAHSPVNQRHYHFFDRNNEVLAVNIDGSAHDTFHNTPIPIIIADYMRELKIPVPENRILECLEYPKNAKEMMLYYTINNYPDEIEVIDTYEIAVIE